MSGPEDSDTVIIHLHGMQGNFFQNSFVQQMLSDYPGNGLAFMTVEQRGAEAVRIFPRNDEMVKMGNAFELFEDCLKDIQAWIDFAVEQGYENIVLQGHSLATMKIAYYIAEKEHRVDAAVLISPSDMRGLAVEDIEGHGELMDRARRLEENGKEDEIVVEDLWGWGYLSAKTFINFFGEDTNTSVFNYLRPEEGFKTVESIDVPVMAFLGTEDDGIVTDAYESMDLLEKHVEPRFEGRVLEGAEHDYHGFEEKLVEEITGFVESVTQE